MTDQKKYKAFDEKDWKNKINLIVDQLHVQREAREVVTQIVDELNAKYGIAKPLARKVATVVFKQNRVQTEEENKEVMELAKVCIS